ncbi:platelet glycoprotein VI-like isoform X2 [Lepidochelys kempii]|uniref:platelet glycoprotein VI-like isoform X2 n=1 Tax=Lepidochelys kempii TaxID=8472 RepID=UPI003C6F337A
MGHALVLFLICCVLRIGRPPAAAAHKASLQVTPAGGVVPAGGRVSLRCLCQVPCARLFLYRGMGPVPVQHAEAWDQAAEFPIDCAGPGDAGTYRCRYLSRYGQPRWSESSDPVRLVVGGTSLDSSPAAPLRDPSPTTPAPPAHSHRPPPGASPDSSHSTPPRDPSPTTPAPPGHSHRPPPATASHGHSDFTQGNIVRLGLGTGVLLALGLVLAESFCSWGRRRPSTKRAARRRGGVPPSGHLAPQPRPPPLGRMLLTPDPQPQEVQSSLRSVTKGSHKTGDGATKRPMKFHVDQCKGLRIGNRNPNHAGKWTGLN